ncbi:MAG: sulfatase-like hydrolase/transferase, partial [Armatimonadetes bacterium]|nr:sulfatase-like hydrolase/transferase [Armatimonadota bacterium]
VTDRRYVIAQYDASIAYADVCLARFFQRLTDLQLWDDTLIVVGADHGEELDEHGCWFDHHGLYETNVRVPLLVRFPDRRAAGREIGGLFDALDVAPTLLSALGLPELMARAGMRGRNLLPWLDSGAVPDAAGIYLTECTWMRKRAWRTPRWKLIRALEPDIYGKPPLELYDLAADPEEQHNLADDRPEAVARLSEAMAQHAAARLAETGLPDPLVAQTDALRIWQPRFIAGRRKAADALER